MVIDIHAHPPPERDGHRDFQGLIDLARRQGIDRLCMLGRVGENGPDPTPEQIVLANTETMDAVKAYPDDLVGFAYLNPAHDPAFIRDEMDRTLATGTLRGIKLWVAVNARDARLDTVMTHAGDLGVPVLHHAWYKTVGLVYNESSPADIACLARRFPQVPIIMAHLTGCGCRGVADVQDCPNVLVDTSGSQPEQGIVEWAVAQLGAERLVYGSDVVGRDFGTQIGRVLGARLTARQRDLILGGNACRLLRLEATR
ncbi:MAG: amidohydrolase family protein [Lentisphaerae bacterium]|nr:amidohydrolase family protein [Lentisphaerota bacterium]